MKKNLDHYLKLLAADDPFTEEQYAALNARIRREIISRYGSFAIPVRHDVHTSPRLVRGMMDLLRPAAFALAGAAAVFALFVSVRSSRVLPITVPGAEVPATVGKATVATLGNGASFSVFGATNVAPVTVVPATAPIARPIIRRPRPVTPAAGVFTTWGTGVFSPQEEMLRKAQGTNVFSS